MKNWKTFANEGTPFGPRAAQVVITEFSDFQCPYCKRLSETLKQVAEAFPTQVSFAYRHVPIDRLHPHARSAAHLAECASRMGRFSNMHDVLFQEQDSIGKLSWGVLADRAGFKDTSAIVNCMVDTSVARRVKDDELAAKELQLRGTPLVLINEWKFAGAPPYRIIDSAVRALLPRIR